MFVDACFGSGLAPRDKIIDPENLLFQRHKTKHEQFLAVSNGPRFDFLAKILYLSPRPLRL